MTITTAFRRITRVMLPASLLLAFGAAGLRAEFECRQELFEGSWVFNAELSILEREGMDFFPPPGPLSAVGIIELDDQGVAAVARQTNSSSQAVARLNFRPALDLKFTVNPDCSGSSLWTVSEFLPAQHPFVAAFGPQGTVFELEMVCASGQRECSATFTQPAAILIGIVRLQRVDPSPAATMDDLMAELAGLKGNLEAVSRRLGLVPKE